LRSLVRLISGLVLVGAVLAIDAREAQATTGQESSPVTSPPEWPGWDSDGDDRLTIDEWDQMSEAEQAALREWLGLATDFYGEDAVRDWARGRFDAPTYALADVPARGVGLGDTPELVTGLGTEAVESAADSALESIANSVADAGADLSGYLGEELARTGRPQLSADWYQEHYGRMLGWAGLLMVPLALASIGSAVAKGDSSQVGQTLLQIPAVYLLGVMAVSLVAACAGLSMAMSRSLVPGVQDSSRTIGRRVGEVLTENPQMGVGLVLLIGLAIALAALATLLWLLLTEAAVYAVVLFFPLAFAGRVWPVTAAWGRRLLTLALALIGARVVIFALWGLAMDGLADAAEGDVPLRTALALAALLVMTATAPTAALRLVPLVEGAETAGSPGAVVQRGLGVAYQGTFLARTGGLMRGGGGRLPVTGQIAGAGACGPAGSPAGTTGGSRGPGPGPDGSNGQPGRPRTGPPGSGGSSPGGDGDGAGAGGGRAGEGQRARVSGQSGSGSTGGRGRSQPAPGVASSDRSARPGSGRSE
jgi:hypothetical protein